MLALASSAGVGMVSAVVPLGVMSLAMSAPSCHHGASTMNERPAARVMAARVVAFVRRHGAAFVGDAPMSSACSCRAAFSRGALPSSGAAFDTSEGFGFPSMASAAGPHRARFRMARLFSSGLPAAGGPPVDRAPTLHVAPLSVGPDCVAFLFCRFRAVAAPAGATDDCASKCHACY